MTTLLFAVPGVRYLLSEKFTQDPLESFFGKQRYKGGWNDNPSVKEFMDNTVSLRIQGSAALDLSVETAVEKDTPRYCK